jgi:hypothetical protein
MPRLLSILSVACLGSTLAACSVSARVPFVGAVGSSAPGASAEQIEESENGEAIASNRSPVGEKKTATREGDQAEKRPEK